MMSHSYTRDWWEELLQVHEFAHFRQYANELTRSEVDLSNMCLRYPAERQFSTLPAATGVIRWSWPDGATPLKELMPLHQLLRMRSSRQQRQVSRHASSAAICVP